MIVLDSRIFSYIIIVLLFLPQSVFTQIRYYGSPDLDYEKRLQELLALPHSRNQTQQISVLFRMWARYKPSDAYDAFQENKLPDTLPHSVMESMIISSWLKVSPNDAMNAAINSSYPETLDLAFRIYAHQDGEEAFNLAQTLVNRITTDTWIGIVEGIASWDPLSAANYVIRFGSGGEKLISGFIYSFAARNPQAAVDWLIENFPDETEHYDALMARFFAIDAQGAREYVSLLPASIYKEKLIISLDRAEKISRGQYP